MLFICFLCVAVDPYCLLFSVVRGRRSTHTHSNIHTAVSFATSWFLTIHYLLGPDFRDDRKVLVMSVCLSVCLSGRPHASSRLSLDPFS